MATTRPKNPIKYYPFLSLGILFLIIISWIILIFRSILNSPVTKSRTQTSFSISPFPTISKAQPISSPTPTAKPIQIPSSLFSVLFTSQAPQGQWSDSRFQDGCEEAASLMAVKWANGESFSPIEAKNQIIKLSEFEKLNYGSYTDTSAQDTANRIIVGYFHHQPVTVSFVTKWQDIAQQLSQGNLVITPMNGRALNNPNFTFPGPERHMVLVIGYVSQSQEFITNDPGTRKGAGYRYPVNIFFKAIWDYPTGDHEPILSTNKTMVIVSK